MAISESTRSTSSPSARRDRALGRLLVVHDVTERARLERSLRDQALTDSLTGLPNRILFMARLENAIQRARRQPDALFAVIVLDLDRFKFINDSIGHLAGDVLLEGVATKLKTCVREADSVARMGGDEFMILLHEITSVRDVLPILERIQEELRAPVLLPQTGDVARRRASGWSSGTSPTRTRMICCALPTQPCIRPKRRAGTATASSTSRCTNRCSGR